MQRFLTAFLSVAMLSACGDDDRPRLDGSITIPDGAVGTPTLPGERDMCGDVRLGARVYFGTQFPTAMPLTEGQILAIGSLGGCTGTFVTDEWILTANHCGVRPGARFCVGPSNDRPEACFTIDEARSHPQADMTLIHASQRASEVVPQLQPIAIMDEALDESWFGRTVEASGFGGQEDGTSGVREFTAQPLVAFEQLNLVIDGMGERGVCFGDSGGPVMGIASDGTVRVLGDLSFGDPSCVGRDRYARTDLAIDWIEGIIGPIVPPEGGGCGAVDSVGQCSGDTAIWCEGDELARESCDTCGWSMDGGGFRCIDGADPCEGETEAGSCDGNTARWCDNGTLRTRDCGACGEICANNVESVGGAYCQSDPCGGISFQGECQGDVAVWCDDGSLRRLDCGARGASCGFVNDQVGFFCIR